ncbi:MAG TPA: carboxypeptidase-like regulatory domain-containing protein, partial [Pyrinomonadaceae bacterium]|nr:carboxypeptidase-like regulatory domain-containing protein [Pyrinomonadaceae bacterium]
MKRSIILLAISATTAYGQTRNSRTEISSPAPGSTGTVTLPLAEYNRLAELAARKPKATDAAPLPFVISSAAFKLRVEEQSLTGVVEFAGTVLEKGSVKVPLTSGLTVLEANQGTSPLPLLLEGTTENAILSGPAPFSLSLSVASPLTIEAGQASFTIPVPISSASLLTLDLPGNHANVRVEPGVVTSRTTANGHTIVEATLEPGKSARVWWTTREIAAPVAQREVRFLSDIKSVVSVGDSQMQVTALCDVTVIQGDAAEFRMPLPPGFELTEATGPTLDSFANESGTLVLKVREPGHRNHQFLIGIERANKETKVDAPVLALSGAQRETGELLVEGVGSMELTPKESGGLRRMDVREVGSIVRSLSRFPLQAAFRFNRRPGDTPKLQLEWTQFPDSSVLSAVAERATITTLTNIEGKTLTEVTLRVRNHSQPFVKVELPAGAQLLSAEVAGERVKPVMGLDGSRVPLLRTGFNPSGPYVVSFVYLNSGTRFAKSGAYEMALPKLAIPVNLLTWELSLPDRLEVKQFGGNALAAELFPAAIQTTIADGSDDFNVKDSTKWDSPVDMERMEYGQVGGIVVDPNGAVIAGAHITVVNKQTGASQTTESDGEGHWVVSNVQPGPTTVRIDSSGFKSAQQELPLNGRPVKLGTTLEVGAVTETVTVTG